MSGGQQGISPMLQHRIHRHKEKSGQSPNPHHQRERQPDRAYPNHADERNAQKHPDGDHPRGLAHRNILRRQHCAKRTTHTDKRLHVRRLFQILAQIQLCPVQHDELHHCRHTPEQSGDRQCDLPQFIRPQHFRALNKLTGQRHWMNMLFAITHTAIRNHFIE